MRFQAARLSFQCIQGLDIDGAAVAEEHHQERQTNGRLRRGHREYEEHEDLPRDISQEVGEGDEVHIHCQQHELDAHEQDDDVLPVEEDPGNTDGEQEPSQQQIFGQGYHCVSTSPDVGTTLGSAGTLTTWIRSGPFLTRTCRDGSSYLVSGRRRRVSRMAATMATNRMTAAISNGYM